jgi:predicted nucleotidyltransferase
MIRIRVFAAGNANVLEFLNSAVVLNAARNVIANMKQPIA